MISGIEPVQKYFPDLSASQLHQLRRLGALYKEWNSRINVISRRDIDELYERHVLHSLGIAKVIQFKAGTKILDVGTGGGFPGIPLAILFPEAQFHLVDSIGKKIKVVNEVAATLNVTNVTASQNRAEELKQQYDFIVSRAVTTLPVFLGWIKGRIRKESFNELPNGTLYLKGGNVNEEINGIEKRVKIFQLSEYFEEDFFETKKVVYIKGQS